MQQVLKSRALLHAYAAPLVQSNLKKEQVQAEAKTWGLCEYRTKRELMTIKFMCWVTLPACAVAGLYLNGVL